MPTDEAKWTADRVLAAIQTRYDGNDDRRWAFFTEVPVNWRGSTISRFDALAVGCWQTDSYGTEVWEVKVARSDWKRECGDPRKRATAERVGNRLWYAAPAGVILDGELPDGWGQVLVTEPGKCRVKREAPWREVTIPPWFLASVARLAQTAVGRPYSAEERMLWRASGRDLTREQLLALAREVYAQEERQLRASVREELEREFEERARLQRRSEVPEVRELLVRLLPNVPYRRYVPDTVEAVCALIRDNEPQLVAMRELFRSSLALDRVTADIASIAALAREAAEELKKLAAARDKEGEVADPE